jgi:uncharacterized protein YqiB (DUF1249 family)
VKGRYRIDLPAHMAECDANYARLMKLAPDLDAREEREIALTIAGRSLRVRIHLVERCPYTSLVELTQATSLDGLLFELPLPRLLIRLYHDARSAEVVEFQNGRRFDPVYPYPNPTMRQRDEKAQINRFLSEYLSLCLSHGAATEETILVADG